MIDALLTALRACAVAFGIGVLLGFVLLGLAVMYVVACELVELHGKLKVWLWNREMD